MEVTLTFKAVWQFKDSAHIKVTKDKMIINCRTNHILKYTTRGFYINGRYLKRNDINQFLEKIPKKEYCPF